jgi:hypothetical protein
MTQVLDFEPQNKIPNLNSVIERLAVQTHSSVSLTPLDETPWATFLAAHESEICYTYTFDMLDEENQKQPFTWLQSGTLVVVTIELPLSDITVTDTTIRSSILSGSWWTSVSNIETSEIGSFTQLELTVDSQWPYLIRGGRPDGLSCYFLAMIALGLKAPEMGEQWLRQGALLGNKLSLTSYAVHLFERHIWPQAFHFLCRAVLNFGDDMCGFLLAKLLIENDFHSDPPLAEYLLCRLCQNGFPRACYLLGALYLNGAPGVEPMPLKAKVLLQVASIRWEDQDAARLLSACDGQEEAEPAGTTAPAQGGATAVDWAIACGIAAGVITLGYFAMRAFRSSK